jgi:uncharacterized protein YbjT (DUF2867 family)
MTDPSERRRALVTGATGYVGGRLVPALLDAGWNVTCLVRTPAKVQSRGWAGDPRVTIIQGELGVEGAWQQQLEGVEVAWYLVHSMGGGPGFHERDMAAADMFGAACRDAGVQQVVYLSGLGGDEDEQLSEHLQSRHATGVCLRATGVPVTELRAGVVIGSGSASFEIMHDLARRLPVMLAPRWVSSRCEPIAIRDVLRYLILTPQVPEAVGRTLEIGCGEQYSYAEMVEMCARALGRSTRIVTVPVLTPRLSSYWLHLVTSVDFPVARALIEGLRNDTVVTDRSIRELVPFEPIGLERAIALALGVSRGSAPIPSRWNDTWHRSKPKAARATGVAAPEPFRDYRTLETDLPPDQLFAQVLEIGGENGYGASVDALWRLRGALDRVVGGTGLRSGRPAARALAVGDPLDFWRVRTLDRDARRLVLEAEMRVPGTALLDLRVEQLPGGRSRLHQLATLTRDHPLGAAYWHSISPLHGIVFQRLLRHIAGLRPAA